MQFNVIFRFMSKITIEPGNHPTRSEEQMDVLRAVEHGELDTHMWNGAVRQRIGAYRPSMMAVDSICPRINNKIDASDKAKLWAMLPGRPSELNGTEEILVIAGDNTYGGPEANTGLSRFLRTATFLGSMYAGSAIAKSTYDSLKKEPPKPSTPQMQIYDQEIVEASEQQQKTELDRLLSKQMTRRTMLGISAAGIAVAANFAAALAAESPFGFGTDAAAEIEEKYSKVDPDHIVNLGDGYDYVDGRTALLIAKLKDMLDFKKFDNPGSLVIGSAHLSKAEDLVNSADLRDEYIRRHTKLLIDEAGKDEKLFSNPSDREQRVKWALDMQKRIQIFRVLEPDEKAFSSSPKREIDRIVELVEEFESPSVIAAVEGILDIPNKTNK
jgi:hypothetical protein